jgi:hypothetical protein
MKQHRWIYETYIICRTQNSKEINWSYPPMRSEDPDPCPASLVMSSEEDVLGSRVDAPQKPNCRSPVQGLERQGLQRHLSSRSLCVQSHEMEIPSLAAGLWLWRFCSLMYQVPGVLLYLTSRGGKLKEKGHMRLMGSWRRRVSHATDEETDNWKV